GVGFIAHATDIAGNPLPVTCAPASGSVFPLGTSSVDCTATNKYGVSSEGTFQVTVQDTTAPSFYSVPLDQNLSATSTAGAIAKWTLPLAIDLVDSVTPVSCTPASGSLFAIGTTLVTCTSADTRDNRRNVTFNVTVQDGAPPALTVPGDIVAEATGAS